MGTSILLLRIRAALALVFAFGFVSGCSKDGAGEQPHRAAVSLDAPAAPPLEDAKLKALDADPKLATVALAYRSRFAMAKELDEEATTSERLRQIAGSLAPAILKKEYVRNPRLQGDDAFSTSLGFFNDAILKLAKRDRKMLDETNILREYADFVFDNCPDSLSSCRNLPFFATDSGSASVLLLVAEGIERDIERLRAQKGPEYIEAGRKLLKLYRTIYTVFNATFQNDYYLRYVKYNADVEYYISSLTSRERKERDQDLRQHQQFLNTSLVLLRAQKDQKSRAAYCDFVIALKPHSYNMSNPKQGGAQDIRQIISQFIECANERGVLDTQIHEYLGEEKTRQSNAKIDDPAVIKDFSYYYALNYLKRTPEILENLTIKDDQRVDLAFFVIDRLFYEAIDQKLATEYWSQIKNIDDIELLGFVENYIKVQTAYTLKATHAIVAKVIEAEYAKHGLSGDLYTRIVDKVNQATQFEWDTLKSRIGFLRGFLIPIFDERIARIGSGAKREATEKYSALKDKLEALADHLNYVATSPIMLVMSYYMSKAPGQIKIFISWWSGTNQWLNIDGSDALQKFFEHQANWIRFFSYGTQNYSFDEHQLKHVFDFSLRTGLFDTVPFGIMAEDRPHMKIQGAPTLNSEWLFFRQFIETKIRKHIASAQKKVDDLEKMLANQEFVDRFNGFCDSPLTAPIRLTLSQIQSSTLLHDSALKSGVAQVYDTTGELRLLIPARAEVEDLRKILEQHFFAQGAEKRLSPEKFAKRAEILGLIDSELEKFYKSERDLFRRMLAADATLSRPDRNCFLRLHKAELLRTNTLYRANVDVYKEEHAAITLMRLLPEDLKLDSLPETERTNPSAALLRLALSAVETWKTSADAKSMGEAKDDVARRMLRNAKIAFNKEVWQALLDTPGSDFKGQPLGLQAGLALSGRFLPQNVKPLYVTIEDANRERSVHEYSVHVDGLESYARSGVLLTPKSELTRKGLRHGKRDTLLRIRRQLQSLELDAKEAAKYIGLPAAGHTGKVKLAGGLEVPLGTFAELANDSFFTDNSIMSVGWVPDQTAFVREAMSQFAGDNRGGNQFVSWHSSPDTYGLSYLRTRYRFMKELYEDGPREISNTEKRGCKVDAWFRPVATPENKECQIFEVSTDNLLHLVMESLNLYRINPEEREILDWIDLTGRFHARATDHFYFTDKNDAAEWTYFERYYKLNFVGREATRADKTPIIADRIDGAGSIETFLDSMRLKIRPERHLFPMQDYVTQFDRNRLRKPLVTQLEQATAFEERIRDLEDEKVDLGDFVFERARNVRTDSRYKDRDWRFVSVNLRKEGERAGTPIYLRDDDESSQIWFRKVVQGFIVTETNCQAMPTAGDPDFDALPEAARAKITKITECRQRYDAWQAAVDAEKVKAREARRTRR